MIKKDELSNPNSCINKADEYEMVFVLRAKDPAAPVAIRAWIAERMRLQMDDFSGTKLPEANHCANVMEYQRENGMETK